MNYGTVREHEPCRLQTGESSAGPTASQAVSLRPDAHGSGIGSIPPGRDGSRSRLLGSTMSFEVFGFAQDVMQVIKS